MGWKSFFLKVAHIKVGKSVKGLFTTTTMMEIFKLIIM